MQNFSISFSDVLDQTYEWKENSEKGWVDCLHEIIAQKPFGNHKFYVFMFLKNVEGITNVKKIYMHPRLTKPDPSPGSTLLKVNPLEPEEAIIIWTLPNIESFGMVDSGKIFSDPLVKKSVDDYLSNPEAMSQPEPDDLSEMEMREIYKAKYKGNY